MILSAVLIFFRFQAVNDKHVPDLNAAAFLAIYICQFDIWLSEKLQEMTK